MILSTSRYVIHIIAFILFIKLNMNDITVSVEIDFIDVDSHIIIIQLELRKNRNFWKDLLSCIIWKIQCPNKPNRAFFKKLKRLHVIFCCQTHNTNSRECNKLEQKNKVVFFVKWHSPTYVYWQLLPSPRTKGVIKKVKFNNSQR